MSKKGSDLGFENNKCGLYKISKNLNCLRFEKTKVTLSFLLVNPKDIVKVIQIRATENYPS